MEVPPDTRIEPRAATDEQRQLWTDGLVDSRKDLPAQSGFVDAARDTLHRTKQYSHVKRLRFDLRKDALVQNVKELRHADEERNAMTVKRINNPLRRYRRQKHDSRARAKRAKPVCDERQDMRKRQNRKNAMVRGDFEQFDGPTNFVVQIVERKLDTFRISRRA